jgi:hypothetical protein
MLTYLRVRSAFEPNHALLSNTIQAFKTVSAIFFLKNSLKLCGFARDPFYDEPDNEIGAETP